MLIKDIVGGVAKYRLFVALSLPILFFGPFFYPLFFILIVWCEFRDHLLPVISEHTVLFYTLLFWCAFFEMFDNSLLLIPAVIALIPTIATLAASYTNKKLNPRVRLLLYIWFILIIVFLISFQMSFNGNFLEFKDVSKPIDFVNAFTTGMASFYFFLYLNTLIMLIPMPARYQSFSDRLNECKEVAINLVRHYNNTQIKRTHAVLMIIAFTAFFAVNHSMKLIPTYLTINLSVIMYSLIKPKNDDLQEEDSESLLEILQSF